MSEQEAARFLRGDRQVKFPELLDALELPPINSDVALSEKATEEDIINYIITRRFVSIVEDSINPYVIFNLKYGTKEIDLKFTPSEYHGRGAFSTEIKTNVTESVKKDNETTLLYLAAKRIMSAFAKHMCRSLKYIFDTGNPNLKKWADGKGKRVFDFDPNNNLANPLTGRYFFEFDIE